MLTLEVIYHYKIILKFYLLEYQPYGFRSGDETVDKFSGLESLFDFSINRTLREFDMQYFKLGDFMCIDNADFLLKSLLLWGKENAKTTTLSEKYYRV